MAGQFVGVPQSLKDLKKHFLPAIIVYDVGVDIKLRNTNCLFLLKSSTKLFVFHRKLFNPPPTPFPKIKLFQKFGDRNCCVVSPNHSVETLHFFSPPNMRGQNCPLKSIVTILSNFLHCFKEIFIANHLVHKLNLVFVRHFKI